MATLTIPHSFTAGTPALASEVNANFQAIVNWTQSNIGTDNLGILTARSVALPSSPTFAILSLSQSASQPVISISNQGTDNPISINQSGVFATGKGAIVINDPTTQTTGAAHLIMSLSGSSTIPAIKVNHGSDVTMSLTKTQLDLFNSAVQATASAVTINTASVSFFSSAIEFSNARIKLPIRTTAERDAVTQEGSVLYNSTNKVVQYRDDAGWKDFTPSGIVQMFAGSTPPTGWLYCNGQAVSRTIYAELFAAIGTTYGNGDGVNTFNVPNFVGIFPRGAAMGGTSTQTISGITYTGGTNNTKQADQLQGHKHNTLDVGGRTSVFTGVSIFVIPTVADPNALQTGTPINDGTNGTPRTGAETRPANIAIAYIIKT